MVAGMRRLLGWVGAHVTAIERVWGRGARRWTGTPVGVQVTLMLGLVVADDIWAGGPWMALGLLLLALPGWIEQVTPGAIKRLFAAIRRNPVIALLVIPAPLSMLHILVPVANADGETGVYGVVVGLLSPFALGMWPDGGRSPAAAGLAGEAGLAAEAGGTVPGFVAQPAPRLTHVGPVLLTLGGAGMLVIGTFLPWAFSTSPLGTTSANGLHGSTDLEAAILLGGAAAIAVAAVARLSARGHAGWRRGVAILCGFTLATLGYWMHGNLVAIVATVQELSIGPGLAVMAVGGAIAAAGGLLPGRPARSHFDHLVADVSPRSASKEPGGSWFVRG